MIYMVQFFKSTISNCSLFEKKMYMILWTMMSQFDIRITVREIYTFMSHILWYKLIVWYTVGKTSNCCLVMAQLITHGKKRGIHLFFVQIRDLKTHRHMPGIDILVHCKILLYYTEIFFKFFYLDLMIHLMSRVCWKTSSLDFKVSHR